MFASLLLALPLLGAVLAQEQISYKDASGLPFTGIYDDTVKSTFGFLFPTSTTGTEFIGEFIVPTAQKWAGISLGGAMTNNPLIMAWPNGNSIVHTTRFATGYVYPTFYSGPVVTTLSYSKVNATYWRWVYRCQNCVSWSNQYGGGSLDQTGPAGFGYATSTTAVAQPSNPNSTFTQHSYYSNTGLDLSTSHNANYQTYLTGGK